MAAAKKSKHVGFAKLEKKLAAKPGITNPGALAASIGRKKYGSAKMTKLSEQGRVKAALRRAHDK